jgi:hypothetical protein
MEKKILDPVAFLTSQMESPMDEDAVELVNKTREEFG